jgi:hypothetical protein
VYEAPCGPEPVRVPTMHKARQFRYDARQARSATHQNGAGTPFADTPDNLSLKRGSGEGHLIPSKENHS